VIGGAYVTSCIRILSSVAEVLLVRCGRERICRAIPGVCSRGVFFGKQFAAVKGADIDGGEAGG
jgi:hypothetical protein